ncbi:MAG TPA: c-type cytochrome [Puia sp.]|nr:c-type cytochrome [Puia sp.]
MKKTIIIFSSALLLMACGGSGDKSGKTDSSSNSSNSATVSVADEKGLELIGASDCTTCHKLDKNSTSGIAIGPAYSDVAAKYSPAADTTIDRLVKKVISGGSGVWGTTPMTPHAALKESDVREMVKYILSLKK